MRSIWQVMSLWSSDRRAITCPSVVMVLVKKGTEVLSDSSELILSPRVGVPTLGSRTCVGGSDADAGELITILGATLPRLEGDGLGILETVVATLSSLMAGWGRVAVVACPA